MEAASNYTWNVGSSLGLTTMGMWDAWFVPSFAPHRILPMPPALARYAVAFYASSLVRYRPSMFDTQVAPQQAYLFDAIARDTAIPMLIDTVSGLTATDIWFLAKDAYRV